jgi:hypothetical protein
MSGSGVTARNRKALFRRRAVPLRDGLGDGPNEKARELCWTETAAMHQAPGEDDIYCDIVIEIIQLHFCLSFLARMPVTTNYVHIKSTTVYASRRNWDSPHPPHPQASVPPPPCFWGEGYTRWRERGWESPNSDEGHTLWYSLYVRTLWPVTYCLMLIFETLNLAGPGTGIIFYSHFTDISNIQKYING